MDQISYLVTAAAILFFAVSALTIWSLISRRQLLQEITLLRREQQVVHGATFGLAKDIRRQQKDKSTTSNQDNHFSMAEAEQLVAAGADTSRLADVLGVSQNEAEIISHLHPQSRYRHSA